MDQEKKRKWLLTAAKLAVVAVLVWFVRSSLIGAFESLREHKSWTLQWGWLVLSGVFYVIGMIPQAIFNKQLLAGVGHPVSLVESLRAYYVSQLGKYVPGKAMVLVLRAGALRRVGLSPTLVTASVFVETLTTMATGALVATICLMIWYRDRTVSLAVAVFMLAATAIPISPPIFKRVIRVLHITKLNLETVAQLAHVRRSVLVVGWISISGCWFMYGLSLWATLVALGAPQADPANPLQNWPLNTTAVALSVVAGFLALIPAGFGIREVVLIPLLAPVYGEEMALLSAIILRLVWLAAEVASSALAFYVPIIAHADAAVPEPVETK